MTGPELLAALSSHPFLREMDAAVLPRLAAGAVPFKKNAGDHLAQEGAMADAFFLIQCGHVSIAMYSAKLGEVTIQTAGPGDAVGWSWLLPPYQWRFDAKAIDEVEGLAFQAIWLREACEKDHELGYQLLKRLTSMLADRLAATRLRLLDLYR